MSTKLKTTKEIKNSPYKPEEDTKLIELREKGLSFEKIAKVMGRSEDGLNKRYVKLMGSINKSAHQDKDLWRRAVGFYDEK